MLNNLHRDVYASGNVIFQEGDLGDCAYLIEEGLVEISVAREQHQYHISTLSKGDLFGEIALIDHLPRTASARAINDVVLIPIPRHLVQELLGKTDPVISHLLLVILERYRTSSRKEVTSPISPAPETTQQRDRLRGVATQKLTLANDMTRALENEEFELHYQPICDIRTGRIAGYEALIRWQHPRDGLMSPLDFLWLAEQTGMMGELGLWTLRRACQDWSSLRRQTQHDAPFISVNISPSQLTSSSFVEDVRSVIDRTNMIPSELKLELTETLIINNPALALDLLQRLASLGSSIALDDFGTGHSGLDSLHRYPIGTMKIDRAFISQMTDSMQSMQIVESSIRLAHSLGMDVVAEGIETIGVHNRLFELGCNFGQGWLFGKPLSLLNIPEQSRPHLTTHRV